jgi:hypothetical protein
MNDCRRQLKEPATNAQSRAQTCAKAQETGTPTFAAFCELTLERATDFFSHGAIYPRPRLRSLVKLCVKIANSSADTDTARSRRAYTW